MQKIRPFLWFDGRAAEAADHYRAVFAESGDVDVAADGDGGSITIGGLELVLFDGGPHLRVDGALSGNAARVQFGDSPADVACCLEPIL